MDTCDWSDFTLLIDVFQLVRHLIVIFWLVDDLVVALFEMKQLAEIWFALLGNIVGNGRHWYCFRLFICLLSVLLIMVVGLLEHLEKVLE